MHQRALSGEQFKQAQPALVQRQLYGQDWLTERQWQHGSIHAGCVLLFFMLVVAATGGGGIDNGAEGVLAHFLL